MTQPTEFTADMIKGNNITWSEEATIKKNDTTIVINRHKKELCNIWVYTPKTANRVHQNQPLDKAVEIANQILKQL